VAEGHVDVAGGRVWYRSEGDGPKTPLLVLHGGPGYASDYLHNLLTLADERQVVVYDQLGSGRSDRPTDPALWTVERFVEEVAQVRAALALEEVHIFGNSWGTALAASCCLAGAEGVRSLVLQGPYLSTRIWEEDNARLLAAMPEADRMLREHLASGDTACLEYSAALYRFLREHWCRVDRWPDSVHRTMDGLGEEPYGAMWGPNDLMCEGSLKGFDITEQVGAITQPTLFISATYDQATPETSRFYQSRIPGSELLVIEGGSHLVNVEREDETLDAVRSFIRRFDR
jgi:proline iminopeptidase